MENVHALPEIKMY